MAYGYAPYEEAATKGIARVSMMQRLGQVFAGAGAGINAARGATNPIESIALGFAGGFGASNAAKQAAEAYAMKKIEAERAQEERQARLGLIEAQTARASRPEKPPPPPKVPGKQQDYEHLISLGHSPDEARQIVYGLTPGEQVKLKNQERPPENTGVTMNDTTMDMAAKVYLETGQLPPMGMGTTGAKYRTQILNRAAQLIPGADVASNVATYKGDSAALRQLQVALESNTAFANTAHLNGAILAQTLNGIPDLPIRFGNNVGRWMASQAGSPGMAKFHTALEVVKPEFAKILSQGSITGQTLTDSARKDMQAVLGDDFTKRQLLASLDILYRDAANKQTSYSQQIKSIRDRLRSKQFLAPSDTTSSNDPLGVR